MAALALKTGCESKREECEYHYHNVTIKPLNIPLIHNPLNIPLIHNPLNIPLIRFGFINEHLSRNK